MMILTIAKREIRSLFYSPLSWTVISVVQALVAYFFLIYLEYFFEIQANLANTPGAPGVTDLVVSPLFITAAIIFLLVVPLLTMRLISDEQRNKTLSLLFSAPISMTDIILGKFLGTLFFIYIMLALVALMPLSLLIGGTIDFGLYFSSLLGLALVVTSFAAIGLFMSTMTSQPVVAAVSSFGILLFLWLMELSVKADETSELFTYISMLHHYTPLMKGIFNSSDIIYYVIFTSVFLILSVRRLDAIRLSR